MSELEKSIHNIPNSDKVNNEPETDINLSVEDCVSVNMHLGHHKKDEHLSMRRYILGYHDQNAIINLDKTISVLKEACKVCEEVVSRGGSILLCGRQAHTKDIVTEFSEETGVAYVITKWLPGTLTNNAYVLNKISMKYKRLVVEVKKNDISTNAVNINNSNNKLNSRELRKIQRQISRIEKHRSGLIEQKTVPNIVIVLDGNAERAAIEEAKQCPKTTIIAIADTNNNVDGAHFVIPANTKFGDSIKSILSPLKEAIKRGKLKYSKQAKTVRTTRR